MKKLSKKVRMAQRVEICKDVIAQLRAGQYQARSNYGYLSAGEGDVFTRCRRESFLPTVDAREVVKRILGPKCRLCQRGGILLSAVRKFNDLQLSYGMQLHNEAMGIGEKGYLERWFDSMELAELEGAFESKYFNSPWYRMYHKDIDRMDAIMRNVIAHDGEFVPTDVPRPRRKPLSEIVRGAR